MRRYRRRCGGNAMINIADERQSSFYASLPLLSVPLWSGGPRAVRRASPGRRLASEEWPDRSLDEEMLQDEIRRKQRGLLVDASR